MKKITAACILVAILATPALAQRKGREPTADEILKKRQEAEVDQRYKNTVQRTSTEATPTRKDPWANVRGIEAPPKR